MRKLYLCCLKSLIWLLILSVSVCAAPLPEQVVLTWSEDTATTQTISWKMSAPIGVVQYGEAAVGAAAAKMSRTVQVQAVTMATNQGDVKQFTATLRQLRPGVRYAYRVGDGVNWSEWRTFRTASYQPKPFKFLVFGDSQSLNYQVWGDTLKKAVRSNPDATFFVIM